MKNCFANRLQHSNASFTTDGSLIEVSSLCSRWVSLHFLILFMGLIVFFLNPFSWILSLVSLDFCKSCTSFTNVEPHKLCQGSFLYLRQYILFYGKSSAKNLIVATTISIKKFNIITYFENLIVGLYSF